MLIVIVTRGSKAAMCVLSISSESPTAIRPGRVIRFVSARAATVTPKRRANTRQRVAGPDLVSDPAANERDGRLRILRRRLGDDRDREQRNDDSGLHADG